MGRTFVLLLAGAIAARCAQAQPDPKAWHVLIEPAFMHPPVSFPIPGAGRTVFVPGSSSAPDADPVYFTKEEWQAANVTWEQFRARARENATEKKLTAQLIRNEKKVVEYAAISSDSPLAATMVLAPDFLKRFRDVFGPKVLVALPNRFTVYVFPALASDYQQYAPMILRDYHNSAFPVSPEVFELSADGIRAIGIFEIPD